MEPAGRGTGMFPAMVGTAVWGVGCCVTTGAVWGGWAVRGAGGGGGRWTGGGGLMEVTLGRMPIRGGILSVSLLVSWTFCC